MPRVRRDCRGSPDFDSRSPLPSRSKAARSPLANIAYTRCPSVAAVGAAYPVSSVTSSSVASPFCCPLRRPTRGRRRHLPLPKQLAAVGVEAIDLSARLRIAPVRKTRFSQTIGEPTPGKRHGGFPANPFAAGTIPFRRKVREGRLTRRRPVRGSRASSPPAARPWRAAPRASGPCGGRSFGD